MKTMVAINVITPGAPAPSEDPEAIYVWAEAGRPMIGGLNAFLGATKDKTRTFPLTEWLGAAQEAAQLAKDTGFTKVYVVHNA